MLRMFNSLVTPLLVSMLVLAPAAAQELTTLRLNTFPNATNLALHMGIANDVFKKRGIMTRPDIQSLADMRGKTLVVDRPNTAYALQAKKVLKNG